ncbi:MAG: response regulator transcription factor [Alloprevotella sp.]|nr:response regulator transcription factor [Alloprevotella sp.]
MATKILVVDDEPDLREILQINLENAGYEVDTAESAEEALQLLSPHHRLLLLDVMLGGMSGFQLAEHLRKVLHNPIPIIFLTAKDTERDMLTGFSAGGDDYMAKPFSLHELLARVKAVVRRTQGEPERALLRAGSLTIDFEKKLVLAAGEALKLSPKEFGILSLLARHPGRVFSREEILAEVWHGETYVLDRTVDVHIARIRRKLGSEAVRLTNRQGYGYCFEENA